MKQNFESLAKHTLLIITGARYYERLIKGQKLQ